MNQPTAHTHQKTKRPWQRLCPGPLTFPREPPRLGPNANAPAVFVILRGPAEIIPGTFGTHSTQVWAICLNPFVDSLLLEKIQNPKTFLGVAWTWAGIHPGSTQPSAAPASPPPQPVSTLWSLCFDVSPNSDCTLSQIRELVWTGTNLFHSRLVWTPTPFPLLHYVALAGTKQGKIAVEISGLGYAGLLLSVLAPVYTNSKVFMALHYTLLYEAQLGSLPITCQW